MKYFTADQHFGHKNIINMCDRPFVSQAEMDYTMIQRWNEIVTNEDTVYHLGDFGFKASVSYLEGIMAQLNGNIIFINGNHDKNTIKANNRCNRFESVHDYLEIEVDGYYVVLFHWPILEWQAKYRKSWHLFGHSHGNTHPDKLDPRQADVGVDVWDFRPVTFEQIINNIPTS